MCKYRKNIYKKITHITNQCPNRDSPHLDTDFFVLQKKNNKLYLILYFGIDIRKKKVYNMIECESIVIYTNGGINNDKTTSV